MRFLLLLTIATIPLAAYATERDRVVVVTATAGFRHESIEVAEETLAAIAAQTGWFDVTFARDEDEMARMLSPAALQSVKLVIFANTTGELALPSRAAFFDWIEEGGSFLGIHSASDTWHESPRYLEMLGGEFETHGPERFAELAVADAAHLATANLPSPQTLFEEIYEFRNFDPSRVRVLLTEEGRPLAWSKAHGAGRVFYTALGHRGEIWTNAWFRDHLRGAIAWGLRRDLLPRSRAVRR